MQMIDLLEKKERAIYQLYLRLQDSDRPLTLKELSLELDLSRSTLARYIQVFCEEAEEEQLGLAFQVEGDYLLMERSPILTKQDILAFLCRESVKYQILLSLFDKEEFSIQGLSQTLLISEATLNRQLSSLNKSLQENKISIRNGRIKGSELQIRYFYFQLFWQTMSPSQMKRRMAYQEQLGNLPIFERFYETSFNPRQEQQLALWLTIQQKRMRLRNLDFQELVQLMKPYEEHKFYKRLRKFALTIHQQYAFSFHEGEIMCLFAFLFSQFLLKPEKLEQVLGFGGPIMTATSWAFQTIRSYFSSQLPMVEEGLYHLNQILSQFYFFQSSIQTGMERWVVADDQFKEEALSLLTEVHQTIYGRKGSLTALEKSVFVPKIVSLYVYLSQVKPIRLRIGFVSSYHQVLAYPLLHQLRQSLERKSFASIEEYQEGMTYDYIISDGFPLKNKQVYYLQGGLAYQDLQSLKAILDGLYQEKELEAEKISQQPDFTIERR